MPEQKPMSQSNSETTNGYQTVEIDELVLSIEPFMLEPLTKPGDDGYVPLCSALQWIASHRGLRSVRMDDQQAWDRAVSALLPLIATGAIELVGTPSSGALVERIPGYWLATIKVLPPVGAWIGDLLLNASSHIDTAPFIDQKTWFDQINDKLYETGKSGPTWTHLQVRKAAIIERWARPEPRAELETKCAAWLVEEMKLSLTRRPKPKNDYHAEAEQKFPGLKDRQFLRAWDSAIKMTGATAWSKTGPMVAS